MNLYLFVTSLDDRELEDLKGILNGTVIGTSHLTHDEHLLMQTKRKIDAIKSVRNRAQLTLKEAKDLVEQFYPTVVDYRLMR